MPRKAKATLSGAPGQPARALKGQPYGEGERAIESQRRMPVPDFATGNAPVPSPGGGAPAGGGQDAGALMAAMQAAQQMAPPTSALTAPTERPDENIMTAPGGSGLPRPLANEGLLELRALARRFPYPELLDLIARAELEA